MNISKKKYNIILSISPIYAEKILKGEKLYEYRGSLAIKDIGKIYIYATSPIRAIIGEVYVRNKMIMEKADLWNKTKEYSGVSVEFYNQYFRNKEIAQAYFLYKPIQYKEPITLKQLNINYSIQSFIYTNEEIENNIKKFVVIL